METTELYPPEAYLKKDSHNPRYFANRAPKTEEIETWDKVIRAIKEGKLKLPDGYTTEK